MITECQSRFQQLSSKSHQAVVVKIASSGFLLGSRILRTAWARQHQSRYEQNRPAPLTFVRMQERIVGNNSRRLARQKPALEAGFTIGSAEEQA